MESCQQSSFATSQVCQSCAHCCKVLRIWVRDCEDIFERLNLLSSDMVSAKKVSMAPYGEDIVFIDLNIPCSQLGEENGTYFCKIWDSPQKPEMCRLYPSNQFVSFDTEAMVREPGLIEKIIEANADFCPLFENLTPEDVLRDQSKIEEEWHGSRQVIKVSEIT